MRKSVQPEYVKRAIQSQRVVTREGIRPATVVYENGSVISVNPWSSSPDALDVGDHYVLPGLVDTHVHINEPGRTEWEGFRTASRAAAAGGITCFVDMPLNCIPATTDVTALEEKRDAANSGSVAGNARELIPLAKAGVRGFKSFLVHPGIEEFSMVGEAELREAMPVIAETGLPLLVHAEHPAFLLEPLSSDYRGYLASRPPESEVQAIQLLIRLCRETRCRVHIVHLSSAKALPDIAAARSEGLPFTVETCPHYLCLSAEEVPCDGTEYKCAPPIREAANQELLWEGLRSGLIDLVATDHSPCPPELKLRDSGDFVRAWGGIASLSLALPLIWTEADRRGFGMEDVVCWMSQNPAQLAGLYPQKGCIAEGSNADFTVFDPDPEWRVGPGDLHFRHPVSPHLDRRVQGKVIRTIVRGEMVFGHGEFASEPAGAECRPGV